jgi:hypothetical protein
MGLLATMVGAWYWALLPAAPRPVPPSLTRVTLPQRVVVEVPTVRLEQLAARQGAHEVGAGARNPFSSSSEGSTAVAAAGTSRHADTVMATAPAAAPAAPEWPRLTLIGLAEAREGDGVVRTAVISGPHGVVHARPGDLIERVYRVERIGGDGVDLQLVPEGRTVRLALRP